MISYEQKSFEKPFELRFELASKINVLILVHIICFLAFSISQYFFTRSGNAETFTAFVNTFLVPFYRGQELQSAWWSSVFVYHFIHFSIGELALSLFSLWFFGHILAQKIGEQKVLMLYFISSLLSALIFIASHTVFSIFSGHGSLEGAFGSVLSIITVALLSHNNGSIRIRSTTVSLRVVAAIVLIASLIFFYKNNMAYILIYVGNLYAGFFYSRSKLATPEAMRSKFDVKEESRFSTLLQSSGED